ncbi:Exd1, partial [Symbiodinium microadriaticum]
PSSDSPSNESQAPSLSPVVVSTLDDMTELQRMELLQCDLFAMDCEGVDLGRSGTICLVQLSTPSACYLFDVLGQDSTSDLMVFLRIILQDRKKTKVIHDCKMDADALFHLCGIQLVGVHDTQSWDVALRGGVATNLNNTLQAYGCKINTQRDHNLYRGNPSFWATRPLTVHMIEWASGDVRHLFDLHRAQMNMVTMAGPEVRAWCVAQSEENADKLRDLVMV